MAPRGGGSSWTKGYPIQLKKAQKQETLQKIADFAGRDNMLALAEKDKANKKGDGVRKFRRYRVSRGVFSIPF